MLQLFNELREITFLSVVVRMLLAFLCGGVIGIERSYKNRPAGFRTHILICIGATVASMTGLYLYLNAHLPTDISRIGAQVVSGLGFIGAGTIIVTRDRNIKGLTTAAGLWASGIIGLAIGAGYYEGGVIATLLVLITEIFIARLETRMTYSSDLRLSVCYHVKTALDQVMRYCKDKKFVIRNLQVTSDAETPPTYTAVVTLRARKKVNQAEFEAHVKSIDGVLELHEVI